MNKDGRPRTFDHNEIIELAKSGLTRSEIAKQVGCSPPHVIKILNKAGFTPPGHSGGANLSAKSNAIKIIEYIQENGGPLRDAQMKLNLDVCAETIRKTAKELGIDICAYRHYKTQRRNWLWYSFI